MKSKKILLTICSTIMLCSLPMGVLASNFNNDVKCSPKLISEEKVLNTDAKQCTIKKYDDKGKILISSEDEIDLQTLNKILGDETQNINRMKRAKSNRYSRTFIFEGRSKQNSNAQCNNTIDYIATSYPRYVRLAVGGGTNVGKWTDGWTKCNAIVLHESFTISSAGISISLPPGLSVSKNNHESTWTSAKVNGPYLATTHQRVGASAMNQNLLRISVTDQADFYVGSTIYKASASISKSYNEIAY